MNNTHDKIKGNMLAASNAANELLNISLENMEELINAQLERSKDALEETSSAIKHMANISSPQELFASASQLVTNTVEKNLNHCHHLYEMMTKAQSRMSKMFESHLTAIQPTGIGIPAWMAPFQNSRFDTKSAIHSFINSANVAVDNATKLANDTVSHVINSTRQMNTKVGDAVKKSAATAHTAKHK
ncbi:MAG: phasin family protein [Burkholderiales bacterium]|nr:phasin family protein [Burkholderiales bacterium]